MPVLLHFLSWYRQLKPRWKVYGAAAQSGWAVADQAVASGTQVAMIGME